MDFADSILTSFWCQTRARWVPTHLHLRRCGGQKLANRPKLVKTGWNLRLHISHKIYMIKFNAFCNRTYVLLISLCGYPLWGRCEHGFSQLIWVKNRDHLLLASTVLSIHARKASFRVASGAPCRCPAICDPSGGRGWPGIKKINDNLIKINDNWIEIDRMPKNLGNINVISKELNKKTLENWYKTNNSIQDGLR